MSQASVHVSVSVTVICRLKLVRKIHLPVNNHQLVKLNKRSQKNIPASGASIHVGVSIVRCL